MITRNQWLAIIGVVLSASMTSTAFLTDSFGTNIAHLIVGFAGFANMILGGVTIILTGQGQAVRDVAAMPGVTRISVNETATSALATVALDPTQQKVGATTPDVRATLKDTVKGN